MCPYVDLKQPKQTKQKQTHRYSEQTGGYQSGWAGEHPLPFKISLVHLEYLSAHTVEA